MHDSSILIDLQLYAEVITLTTYLMQNLARKCGVFNVMSLLRYRGFSFPIKTETRFYSNDLLLYVIMIIVIIHYYL